MVGAIRSPSLICSVAGCAWRPGAVRSVNLDSIEGSPRDVEPATRTHRPLRSKRATGLRRLKKPVRATGQKTPPPTVDSRIAKDVRSAGDVSLPRPKYETVGRLVVCA